MSSSTPPSPTTGGLPDRRIVVMGASGCGKSTVGRALAERLGVPFADADDLHPAANVAKMAAGIPLDDEDRAPWLRDVGRWLGAQPAGGVIACSALRRSYRDLLRSEVPHTVFLHLDGDRAVLEERVAARPGHFMPATLVASQLATLEPLEADEAGTALDVRQTVEALVENFLAALPPEQSSQEAR
ncbi:gluconokinase [Actinotalea sp.]|uniref:gluconokinase n=1 Tax=Actinotalea sp. TaxID=1872145 RepID=UPI00356381DD